MSEPERRVPAELDRAAAWAWRLLVVGAAAVALLYLVSRLRLVLLPVGVAFLLSTVLIPPTRWLASRGLPRWAAAWVSMLGFLLVVVGVGATIVTPLVDDADQFRTTLGDAVDDIEDWLVDGPLALERSQVDDARDRIEQAVDDLGSSDGAVLDGVVLAGEFIAGLVLSLVVTFFLVKDGERLQAAAVAALPDRHEARARRMGAAAWSTLGHYLMGAAALGFVEAVIIGITLLLVGSEVIVPVVVLTFAAAFFPFVGAVVAGVVAVLVTLASSGVGAAAVVAVVALLVQQFDNELLAPLIYGRALSIHPLVVILAVTTGAAVGGIVGAFIAVPVVAIAVNAVSADRAARDPSDEADAAEPSPA